MRNFKFENKHCIQLHAREQTCTLSQSLLPALGGMCEELIVQSRTTESGHSISSNLFSQEVEKKNKNKTNLQNTFQSLKKD